jgi:hypothetical protein
MLKDERDLLDVLKFELYFLEQGGYQRPSRTWRPPFIFEDSPTCPNCGVTGERLPCSKCSLVQIVPFRQRFAAHACRSIPLNEAGETLDSLYRQSNEAEIEEVVGNWLRGAIKQMEERHARGLLSPGKLSTITGEAMLGQPLYQTLHPKCANLACPVAFHWTGGGRFFRFRPESSSIVEGENKAAADTPVAGGTPVNPAEGDSEDCGHGMKHYWLCEKCSRVYTLAHDDTLGVIIKLLWTQIPAPEVPRDFRLGS